MNDNSYKNTAFMVVTVARRLVQYIEAEKERLQTRVLLWHAVQVNGGGAVPEAVQ